MVTMYRRRSKFNPKRAIENPPVTKEDRSLLDRYARRVTYGGNPEHKKNRGDFELGPSKWHTDKELCDRVKIFSKAMATKLLRRGIRKGLISKQKNGEWPQNIWSVTPEGEALEAQIENPQQGTYHGYPMSPNDPFRDEVIERWNKS